MEKMLSEFRTFGESLSIVRERVDRMEPKLDQLSEEVNLLESVARSNNKDIRIIKSDIADIKVDLKSYNQRLELVEAKPSS